MKSKYDNFINEEFNRQFEIFYNNAFLLLDHAERIMADPRMANAKIIGAHSAGENLGIYIEWWLSGGKYIRYDEEGCEALTVYYNGRP